MRLPAASRSCEKSPLRQADSGSDGDAVSDLLSRSPSQLNMKNSLSRPFTSLGMTTGPPAVTPYCFRVNGGIGRSAGSK